MATAWKWVAYFALPIPIALMILLSLPLPRVFRKGVLLFTERVFGLTMIGAFRLLHIMLFLTGSALLSTLQILHKLRALESTAVWPTANAELAHLSKRWRAERNSYIAAFAFTMWCALAAFYREAVHRLKLEERLEALERSRTEAPAAPPGRERPAPAGGPREAPGAKEKPAAPSSGMGEGVDKGTGRVAAPAPIAAPVAASGIEMQAVKKEL